MRSRSAIALTFGLSGLGGLRGAATAATMATFAYTLWSFHWPPFGDPFWVTPGGKVIRLEVQGDVPYFNEHEMICQPIDPNETFVVQGPKQSKSLNKAKAGGGRKAAPAPEDESAPEGGRVSAPTDAAHDAGGAEPADPPIEDDTSGSEDEGDINAKADGDVLMMDNEKPAGEDGLIGKYEPEGD